MPAQPASPPVLLMVFNRPALLRRVLTALAENRPPTVYVAADGPRAGHPTDAARCAEVRALVQEPLPWPCTVRLLLREENLGLQQAVTSAIDWFFAHETMGAILEDDCLPARDFLPFVGEMLRRFESNPAVMHVSGVTMRAARGGHDDTPSYHAAHSGHIWGWATWRRAWQQFEPTLAAWPTVRDGYRRDPDPLRRALGRKFASAHAGRKWTWSRAWYWTMAQQRAVSIIPAVNLVENIGDGPDATHVHGRDHPLRHRFGPALSWPLQHPSSLAVDHDYDRLLARYHRGSWRRRFADQWWALRERLA